MTRLTFACNLQESTENWKAAVILRFVKREMDNSCFSFFVFSEMHFVCEISFGCEILLRNVK